MNPFRFLGKFLLLAALTLASTSAFAGVFVSVNFAPPPLPVYAQPLCPAEGYIWVPGYWAYGPYGYYWVPGTWVLPPEYGVLWTPGYWGWGDGAFFFHFGYWGPHVGFYGGVNYGYGYGGRGYGGGRWQGRHFYYNTAVNNVNSGHFHNTYVDRNVVNNVTSTRNVSYNGGNGGIQARPTAQEQQFAHQSHIPPTSVQQGHMRAAARDPGQLASVNGGRPQTLAAPRPQAYRRVAQQHAQERPLNRQNGSGTQLGANTIRSSDSLPQHQAEKEQVSHTEQHTAAIHEPLAETRRTETHATAPIQHVHPQAEHPKAQAHSQPQHNAKPAAHSDKPQQNH